MSKPQAPIPDEAIDGLSVVPGRPEDENEDVDVGSEDSMGASDPPSTSAPGSDRDVEQAREESRQNDA